ncbi:hypothetical protein BGZ99_005123 [Dissophora globulifera]|uniref:Uncharacterized protein n=1 Tax=Dissophora globulifera TaxID=979702 RepID=A0A9P6RFW9_9FUNG|nr:hypothetical protein BGZ99_005123 [Dissophora globulifera]
MTLSDTVETRLHPAIHEYSESLSLTAEQQRQLAEALQLHRNEPFDPADLHPEQQQQQLQQQQKQQHQQHPQQHEPSQQRRSSSPSPSPSSSSASAYAAWARAQATGSSYLLVAGGILCLLFPEALPGIYSM